MKWLAAILSVLLALPARAADERCSASGSWEGRIAACTALLASANEPYSRSGALFHRGEAYLALGETLMAVRDLDAAARLAPNRPAPHLALGIAYLEAGRPDRAREALDVAARLAPGSADILHWRAFAEDRLGRPEAALADLDRALDADPAHPSARLTRARLRCGLGDHEGAVADTQAALASGAMGARRLAGHLAEAGFGPLAGEAPLSEGVLLRWARAGCP